MFLPSLQCSGGCSHTLHTSGPACLLHMGWRVSATEPGQVGRRWKEANDLPDVTAGVKAFPGGTVAW